MTVDFVTFDRTGGQTARIRVRHAVKVQHAVHGPSDLEQSFTRDGLPLLTSYRASTGSFFVREARV
jgi:hypothetical protein